MEYDYSSLEDGARLQLSEPTSAYLRDVSASILQQKSYSFAVRIVKFARYLREEQKAFDLSRQVFRAGTSVGANVHEAEFAFSRADFAHKMSIALKEINETRFWINLSFDSKYITEKMYVSIATDCSEVLRILAATVKTSKGPEQR